MAETQPERPSTTERAPVAERVDKRLQDWAHDRFGSDEVVAANLNYYENVHNALSGKPQEVFEKLRGPWERMSQAVGITATTMDAGLAAVYGVVGYRIGRVFGLLIGAFGFGLPVSVIGTAIRANPAVVRRIAVGGASSIGEAVGASTGVRSVDRTLRNRPFRRLYRKEAEIMGRVMPKAIETAGNLQDRVHGVIDRLRSTWRNPPEESTGEQVFVGTGRASEI